MFTIECFMQSFHIGVFLVVSMVNPIIVAEFKLIILAISPFLMGIVSENIISLTLTLY